MIERHHYKVARYEIVSYQAYEWPVYGSRQKPSVFFNHLRTEIIQFSLPILVSSLVATISSSMAVVLHNLTLFIMLILPIPLQPDNLS